MQEAVNDAVAIPQPAVLLPTDALRKAFQFERANAGDTALAAAYATSAARPGVVAGSNEVQQREGFFIGHLGLMIRYEDGSALSDMPATYQLPNAPEWFVGVANLHGLLIPVFDLTSYLGIDHQQGVKPMLLVLGHGNDAAGVVIDGMPVRLRFKLTDRAEGAPVPSALEGCASQTYWASERTWMDLKASALLSKLSDELAASGP